MACARRSKISREHPARDGGGPRRGLPPSHIWSTRGWNEARRAADVRNRPAREMSAAGFDDPDPLVGSDGTEHLLLSGGRPGNLDAIRARGGAQPDPLPQRPGAVAATGSDRAMKRARGPGLGDV